MMLMTGIAALSAAIPLPEAQAYPSRADAPAGPVPAPTAPPLDAATGNFLFADEFDGPAGSGPDPAKWTVFNWDEPVTPPILGHYRDDRRNVFLDGNSHLVLCATQEGPDYYSGKIQSNWKGAIGTTWEAALKFDCLTPGCWPAFWLVNENPLPDGEIDVVEWYGNGAWPPGSTVHAASNGKTWSGKSITGLVDNGWHRWRCQWSDTGFRFWRDYVDGAAPYLSVPAVPIKVHGGDESRWPFNQPDYLMSMLFSLAVGGPGGGDPNRGVFPAVMLVDWVRVW